MYKLCLFTNFCGCDDHHYVVGYSKKHKKVTTLRMDCIEKSEVTIMYAVPNEDIFTEV